MLRTGDETQVRLGRCCRVEHFIPVKAWTAGIMAQAYECFGFPAAVLYLQVVLIYAVMDSDGD